MRTISQFAQSLPWKVISVTDTVFVYVMLMQITDCNVLTVALYSSLRISVHGVSPLSSATAMHCSNFTVVANVEATTKILSSSRRFEQRTIFTNFKKLLKFANFDEFEKVTNSATVCNCGTNRQTTPTWITEYTDSSAADIVVPGARIDPCLIPEDVMKGRRDHSSYGLWLWVWCQCISVHGDLISITAEKVASLYLVWLSKEPPYPPSRKSPLCQCSLRYV